MDETWIHHYTPESSRQSAEWITEGENRPKRPKTQMSAGKVLASVFQDAHGDLLIDCLEKERTINSEYYMHFRLLPHPPYSPDLAPSDYYLFVDLKRMLQGKRFDSNEEVIAATEAYFEANDKSLYKKGIEMLEKYWNECITLEEDYVELIQSFPKTYFFISHPTNLLSDVLHIGHYF